MKKSELRKIIKEEIKSTLNEGIGAPGLGSGVLDTGGMSGHQGSGISDGDKMMQRLHGKKKEGQQMEMKGNVLSTIDELNQFLNGNVTAEGLKDALESMIYKLNRLNYK